MRDRRRACFSRFLGLALAVAVWLSASLPAPLCLAAAAPTPAGDACCASQPESPDPEPAEKQGDCTRRCVAACCALHAVPAAPVSRVLIETPAIADSPLPPADTGRLVTDALLDPPRPLC